MLTGFARRMCVWNERGQRLHMTLYLQRSFPILAVVVCLIGVAAAPDGVATWPLLAPVAFSSAVMLWALLTGPSLLNTTMHSASR